MLAIQNPTTAEQNFAACLKFRKELNALWDERLLNPLQAKFGNEEEIQLDQNYFTIFGRGEPASVVPGSDLKEQKIQIATFQSVSIRLLPALFCQQSLFRACVSLERQLLSEVLKLAELAQALERQHTVMLRQEVISYLDASKMHGRLKLSPISVLTTEKDTRAELVCHFNVEELWIKVPNNQTS